MAQLVLRQVDYEFLVARHGPTGMPLGRHLVPGDEPRHANALVDFVAVGESFVSARLLIAHPHLSEDDVFTWMKRKKAWKSQENVDLSLLPGWKALQGHVEVRNALQHGLGRLTDFQLKRREELFESLRAADVRLVGDRVHVDSQLVRGCFGAVRDFVISLDSMLAPPAP